MAYRLRDLNDNPTGSLYEGKVITDTTFGNVTYGCMICCGPNSPWMIYDPIGIRIDGFGDQGVQAINSCSNRLVPENAYLAGTTTVPPLTTDPGCYSTSSPGRQIVIKDSIPDDANGNGAPAFLFERQKTADSDPAIVGIS